MHFCSQQVIRNPDKLQTHTQELCQQTFFDLKISSNVRLVILIHNLCQKFFCRLKQILKKFFKGLTLSFINLLSIQKIYLGHLQVNHVLLKFFHLFSFICTIDTSRSRTTRIQFIMFSFIKKDFFSRLGLHCAFRIQKCLKLFLQQRYCKVFDLR